MTMAEKSCPAGTTNHAFIHAGCLLHKGPCESTSGKSPKHKGPCKSTFGKNKSSWQDHLYHTHPEFAGTFYVLMKCALKFNFFRFFDNSIQVRPDLSDKLPAFAVTFFGLMNCALVFAFLGLFDDSIHVRVIGIQLFDFELFDDSVHVSVSSVAQQSSADAARIGTCHPAWASTHTVDSLQAGYRVTLLSLSKGVSSYSQLAGCLQ